MIKEEIPWMERIKIFFPKDLLCNLLFEFFLPDIGVKKCFDNYLYERTTMPDSTGFLKNSAKGQ